jgi:general secretion pathway protein D
MTPCLGTIPGVGWLFKSVSDSQERTNLYIFLTPHIVETPLEAEKVYQEKKEEMDKIREGGIKMYKRRLEEQEQKKKED